MPISKRPARRTSRISIEAMESRLLLSSVSGAALLNASNVATNSQASAPSVIVPNAAQVLISTTTTLTASSAVSALNESVTLTATVTPSTGGVGSPTGSFTFKAGNVTLGSAAVGSSGIGTLSTTIIPVGTNSLTAIYSGDTIFAGSTSSPLSHVVNRGGQATTNSALTSSANPITFGQTVAFVATVTSASGSPNGTVTFLDGSSVIGTATVNTITHQAIAFINPLAIGSHNITAVYNGANSFAPSTSAILTQVVNSPVQSTTTTLVSSGSPSMFGQTVAFVATVTAPTGSPTGSVTFLDGSSVIGTANINTATNQATAFINPLSIGTHTITAVYGGATNFTASTSSPLTQVVNPAGTPTTTLLTTSASPINFGHTIAFTATVTAATGSPGGTVTFMDGTALIGTVMLNIGTHLAIDFVNPLPVGTHTITAIYNGAKGFAPSTSAPLTQIVNSTAATSTTALVASANPIQFGQTVAFVATVTSPSGLPNGTVTFLDGTSVIGTSTLNTVTGQAVDFVNPLQIGSHAITAQYNGTNIFQPSTSPILTEVVFPVGPPTTTALTSSGTPSLFGHTLAFVATVTSTFGTPTGTVTFMDGSNFLGSASIDPTTNQAIDFVASMSVGSHTITAIFAFTAEFSSSTSAPFTQVVKSISPSIATTSSASDPTNVFASNDSQGVIAKILDESSTSARNRRQLA